MPIIFFCLEVDYNPKKEGKNQALIFQSLCVIHSSNALMMPQTHGIFETTLYRKCSQKETKSVFSYLKVNISVS